MSTSARAANKAGTLSAAGEALHKLPPIRGASLDLGRADQLDRLDDAGPGGLDRFGMFAQFRAAHRRADAKTAILGRYATGPRRCA